MKCVVCSLEQAACLDYGIYERGGVEAMICTEHQPIAEIQEDTGSLEHTENLDLLRKALKLTWKDVDKPEGNP